MENQDIDQNLDETTSNTEIDSVEENQSEVESTNQGDERDVAVDEGNLQEDSDVETQSNFQELQESRKTLWEEEREKAILLESQLASHSPLDQYNQLGFTVNELKTSRLEQEMLWDKAESKFPELGKDKELQDLVYSNYLSRKNEPGVTPLKVAGEVIGFLNKREKRVRESTYKQAEDDITSKSLVNTKPPRRSGSTRGDTNADELKLRARQGDQDAINQLLRII